MRFYTKTHTCYCGSDLHARTMVPRLMLLYEIHDIHRFPRVNAHLTGAFSEAAMLFLRNNAAGQKLLARLQTKHGMGKALTGFAHT